MPKFNLDEWEAQRPPREPFTFTHGGVDYVLPGELDVNVALMFVKGEVAEAFPALLGAAQWECLRASPTPMSISAMQALMEQYGAYVDPEAVAAAAAASVRRNGSRHPQLPGVN